MAKSHDGYRDDTYRWVSPFSPNARELDEQNERNFLTDFRLRRYDVRLVSRVKIFLWTSALIMGALTDAQADRFLPTAESGSLGTYFENDVFGGSDKDYTNGLRIAWASESFDAANANSLLPVLRCLGNSTNTEYFYGFSLTQLIFTPDEGSFRGQPIGERRYAGWLGLGGSLHAKTGNVLNSVELTLGTTGSRALAEEAQDLIHDLIGTHDYEGWNAQIPNEFTVDLAFTQKQRWDLLGETPSSFGVDGMIEWGARLGTFRTLAHAGGSLRAGWNLSPDFIDRRISEISYAIADREPSHSDWSGWVMVGANGRAVAHDATLDGPLFHDFQTGNHRKPLVGAVFAGMVVRFKRCELSYIHALRTKEYDEQESACHIGTMMLTWQF